MGSECTITPVCGVTCIDCPAFDVDLKPTPCMVMRAAILAFQAQEDYWACKIQHENQGQ